MRDGADTHHGASLRDPPVDRNRSFLNGARVLDMTLKRRARMDFPAKSKVDNASRCP